MGLGNRCISGDAGRSAARSSTPRALPPTATPTPQQVLINSLTKVPGLLLCLVDMIISMLPLNEDHPHPPVAAHALRVGLFGTGTLVGWAG